MNVQERDWTFFSTYYLHVTLNCTYCMSVFKTSTMHMMCLYGAMVRLVGLSCTVCTLGGWMHRAACGWLMLFFFFQIDLITLPTVETGTLVLDIHKIRITFELRWFHHEKQKQDEMHSLLNISPSVTNENELKDQFYVWMQGDSASHNQLYDKYFIHTIFKLVVCFSTPAHCCQNGQAEWLTFVVHMVFAFCRVINLMKIFGGSLPLKCMPTYWTHTIVMS